MIQILHPIWHNGTEYNRGIVELTPELEKFFVETCPHAAIFVPAPPASSGEGDNADTANVQPKSEPQKKSKK